MATLLQHCGNEGNKDYGEGQIFEVGSTCREEMKNTVNRILRVFDQGRMEQDSRKEPCVFDIDGFLSVSGWKMSIEVRFDVVIVCFD